MQWFEAGNPNWGEEVYDIDEALPRQLTYDKLSLVRVNQNGSTQPGWGAREFMDSYAANRFDPQRSARFYEKYQQPFAYVMRSLPMVCVDIDGKNGGIQTAQVLDLPPTFAESSRSGNGYHLFYSIPYTRWHETLGYNEFPDVVGLIPGVDIKGTGLVFHYPSQRWNNRDVAKIPPSLAELIGRARDVRFESRITREGTGALDDEELLLLQDQLLNKLEGKFPVGERNNRLYKIGAQLAAAQVPDWEQHLYRRGAEIGLFPEEIDQLVKNITNYG